MIRSKKYVACTIAAVLIAVMLVFAFRAPATIVDSSELDPLVRSGEEVPSGEFTHSSPPRSSTKTHLNATTTARQESMLPAENTPLAQSFDVLADSARNGNVQAALRLVREVNRCRRLAASTAEFERVDLDTVRMSSDPSQVEQQVLQCLAAPLCSGTTELQLRDPTQWLLAAALGGDLDARAIFATGDFLYPPDLEAMSHIAELRLYGRRWLEEGAARGHRASFQILGDLFIVPDESYGSLTSDLVPQDLVRGLAYRLADAQMKGGASLDNARIAVANARLRGQISSSEQMAVEQLAREIIANVGSGDGLFELYRRVVGTDDIPRNGDSRCITEAASAELRKLTGRDKVLEGR